MREGIQETERKLFFYESINKAPLTVELSLGWIRITQYEVVGGFLGHKKKYTTISITSEDALKLKECIERLVNPQR